MSEFLVVPAPKDQSSSLVVFVERPDCLKRSKGSPIEWYDIGYPLRTPSSLYSVRLTLIPGLDKIIFAINLAA